MEVDGCNVDAVDGDASAVELDEPEERDEEGALPPPVRPTTPTFSLASTESEKLWSTSGRPCGEMGGEQWEYSGHRMVGIEQFEPMGARLDWKT